MTDLYYIQNKEAGYLGNSPRWYARNGSGYTAYIQGAERFPEERARRMVEENPDKWRMFKCADVDQRLHLIYDSQDNDRLGTAEPCGWAGGYAEPPKPQRAAEMKDFRSRLGWSDVEANSSDTLAVALCTYFDNHLDKPDDDQSDDDNGWHPWVSEMADKALKLITETAQAVHEEKTAELQKAYDELKFRMDGLDK